MSSERMMARMIAPVVRRMQNVLARGTVVLVNAATKMQTLQVQLLAEETLDALEHFEPYGFTSHPLPGAEVAALFVDGDRSHGLVLVVADRRYRIPGLQAGEVALHDDSGSSIVLKRGGVIEITAANEIRMVSALLTHNGVNVGSTHVHGGVDPGPSNTGTPA